MLIQAEIQVRYADAGDKLPELVKGEWRASEVMLEARQLVGIWRKADANGVILVWDMPDHDTLNARLRAMPLYPYFGEVRATPLIPHPNFPQFAKPATAHEKPVAGQPYLGTPLYWIDLTVDYARIGDAAQTLVPAEWREEEAMLERRQLVGIWRKATARGVFMLAALPDPDAVNAQIRAMPLYPYFSSVQVTPLIAHPNFPQFARPATTHEKP